MDKGKDPLDEYMANLCQENGDMPTFSIADARKEYQRKRIKIPHPINPIAKNRRYQRLKQLLQKQEGKTFFFSEEEMQRRSPALYYAYIGKYINQEEQIADKAANIKLSSILLGSIDRTHLEQLKIEEERTWGFAKEYDEVEKDEDDDDENDENLSDMDIEDMRAQFLDVMCQRFLNGEDFNFVDYEEIDKDLSLDQGNLDKIHDLEEKYFDEL